MCILKNLFWLFYLSLIIGISPLAAQNCIGDCVWPGDANQDGICDNVDLLYTALGFIEEGPSRLDMGTDWSAKEAIDWFAQQPVSGINLKHADATGDGLINFFDIDVIFQNYTQTNDLFTGSSGSTIAGNDLQLVWSKDTISAGETVRLDVHLGDENNVIEDIWGLAFQLEMDTSLIKEDDIVIPPSVNTWMGSTSEAVYYTKYDPNDLQAPKNRLDYSFFRLHKNTASGHGLVLSVDITIEDNISGLVIDTMETPIINIKNVLGMNDNEVDLQITSRSTPLVVLPLSTNPSPTSLSNPDNSFPNLANLENYEYQYYDLNTHTWQNQFRRTSTYTPFGQIEEEMTEQYHYPDWLFYSKKIFTYASDESLENIIQQKWNAATQTWENEKRTQYINDANLRLEEERIAYWDEMTWIDAKKSTYTYTSSGDVDEIIHQIKNFETGGWINARRQAYVYDANKLLITTFDDYWSLSLQDWQSDRRIQHFYDEDLLDYEEVNFRPANSSFWLDKSRKFYSYNNSNHLDGVVLYTYSIDLDAYKTIFNLTIEDDIQTRQFRNYYQEDWINLSRKVNIPTSIYTPSLQDIICQFPNPISANAVFNCTSTSVHLEIYNSIGRLLFQYPLTNGNANFPTSLSDGMYLFHFIDAKGNRQIEKVVVASH